MAICWLPPRKARQLPKSNRAYWPRDCCIVTYRAWWSFRFRRRGSLLKCRIDRWPARTRAGSPREGEKVVNMRLEATVLTETSRRVLQQLDGKHDRAALAALVQARIDERASDDAAINAEQYVEQLLQSFARGALLVG